jgi:predicted HTH transcriptional regulator
MKQGTSKIRNTVIARVFRELHLIEQWGTGVRRIFAEARKLGMKEPEIVEVGMRLRFIVPLLEPIKVKTGTEQVGEQVGEQVTQQVTQQVIRLLKVIKGEMNRSELMQAVALKDRVNFSKNYLEPAIRGNMVEMTQPDSPKSPTQKYRLTDRGREIVQRIGPAEKEEL